MALQLVATLGKVAFPALVRGLPAATRLLTRAVRPIGRFLAGSPKRATVMALAVAPTTVKMVEHHTGGAVTEALFNISRALIEEGIERGVISAENLEQAVDVSSYGVAVSGAYKKSAQNQYVQAAMGDSASPDYERGQQASLSWLMEPSNMTLLTARNIMRTTLVDKVIDNRDEADRYLAENFVQDIINTAHVDALGDNQVSEEDVKEQIQRIYNDPNSDLAERLRGTRLENGLLQMWPDLAEDQSQNTEVSSETDPNAESPQLSALRLITQERERINNLNSEGLSAEFNSLNVGFLNKVLAAILGFFGLGDHFKRAVVIDEKTDDITRRFNLHSGTETSNAQPQSDLTSQALRRPPSI